MDIRNEDCTSLEAEIKPDLEKLRAYTNAKLRLAGQLRILREALKDLGREQGEQQCGELVVKLAEDRFTLAVLGQFKRGKSSLMNAIIGRELLPTGVLPLTSAITVLKYGPTERLVVHRANRNFPEELPVSALADYVTEEGNPSNQKKVTTAYVELPVPFLRRGIEFVDTPGVGSAITANTATTYSFLPKCDAVLFVTSVDTPMTSSEMAFLKDIRDYVDRIFFVVNKVDLVANEESRQVIEFVTETIRKQIKHDVVKVFPVSARQGLAARMSGDTVLYEHSGLKALEEALASFLSEEKSVAFLTAVAQKALRILADETAQDAFNEAALQNRAMATPKKKSTPVLRNPQVAAAAAIQARTKIEALHESITSGRMAELSIEEVSLPDAAQSELTVTPAVDEPVPAVIDMAVDLRIRGCPVCQHIAKQAWDFFAHWQYQIGTEEQAQAEFAAELGFCPLHTWQLLSMSSPHGASVGYARMAEHIARRLRETAGAPAGDTVRRLVHDSRSCRVCAMLQRAEEEYIRRLATMISEAAGRKQYRHSQGVCLRHLGMLMDAVGTAESREFLLFHAAQRFEEDAEDMRSFAMKHEAIRRVLQNRDEEDAYRRAVIRIVGDRRVCMPWAEDGRL